MNTNPVVNSPESGGQEAAPTKRRRISMHEGIAVWCDCCSCAAEPYWLEVAEELGVDLGSDYEEEVVEADSATPG